MLNLQEKKRNNVKMEKVETWDWYIFIQLRGTDTGKTHIYQYFWKTRKNPWCKIEETENPKLVYFNTSLGNRQNLLYPYYIEETLKKQRQKDKVFIQGVSQCKQKRKRGNKPNVKI